MSAIPHPAWCDPRSCTATDVDGQGDHVSAQTTLHGTSRFPLTAAVQIQRVDSAEFGHPWIALDLNLNRENLPGEALMSVADVWRLIALLADTAKRAEAAERGLTS